jgi:hypothetical protein
MASSATPSLPADRKQFMADSISLSSPQDVWIAGGNDTGSDTWRSSLWHWDGLAWSVVELGGALSRGAFRARSVFALAADDVWVLCQGSTTASGAKLERLEPFFLHFDGAVWRRVPAAPPAGAQR